MTKFTDLQHRRARFVSSFYEETQERHKSMVKASFQIRESSEMYPVVDCIIKSHADILNIPKKQIHFCLRRF